MRDRFRSLFTRQREFESRVHTELTTRSRERIASITGDRRKWIETAFGELADEAGPSRITEVSPDTDHTEFIMNADTVLVLSYIEHYFRAAWNQVSRRGYRGSASKTEVNMKLEKIKDVIITEGLLWEVEGDNGRVRFRPIESEAMEDMEENVQALAEDEPWDDALKGYNAAFERYLAGDFDHIIPKKLYYSIEEVLKIICVDEEEWTTNRELQHSDYLEMLKDKGVYDAHGVTATELDDLLDSLERMVAKVGGSRKQEHAFHDRTYATLLIHQVGAYLYFLINRYEEYSQ